MMTSQTTTWKSVETLLRDAFAELSPPSINEVREPVSGLTVLTGTVEDFLEFLEHNELELAWDELESMGRRGQRSETFWLKLSEAAATMNLSDKAAAALKRSRAEP
jgi:hypothetical protein